MLVNLTPHEIRFNDGSVLPPSGSVARVQASYNKIEDPFGYLYHWGALNQGGFPIPIFEQKYGGIGGLPSRKPGRERPVRGLCHWFGSG